MATPIIQSSGSVSGAGTAGQGRNDLVIGETVTLSDTEAGNSGASYVWTFEDLPTGSSASFTGGTTATPTFSPDVTGSYRILCTVNGSANSVIVVAVPLAFTDARIPSFEEELEYNGAGNTKGWHPALAAFMRSVDDTLNSRILTLHPADRGVAAGLTRTTGNYTQGMRFYVTRSGVYCTGIRTGWKASGSQNVKMSLFNDAGTNLANGTVACGSDGVFTVTFASKVALTPNTLYVASFYETSGTNYVYWSRTNDDPGAASGSAPAGIAGDTVVVGYNFYQSGDGKPSSQAGGEFYPVEPILTL